MSSAPMKTSSALRSSTATASALGARSLRSTKIFDFVKRDADLGSGLLWGDAFFGELFEKSSPSPSKTSLKVSFWESGIGNVCGFQFSSVAKFVSLWTDGRIAPASGGAEVEMS